MYLKHGKGSKVCDVDGTEYTDFHGGFGVNVVGHAHPKIVEAIKKAAEDAIHFAVTTENTVALAEEICERFQCDQMRFVNSGTEATMDAIRVARAATGRDRSSRWRAPTTATTTRCCSRWSPRPTCSDLRHNVDQTGKPWYTTQPTSKGVPAGAVGHHDHRAVQRRGGRRAGVRRQPGTRSPR